MKIKNLIIFLLILCACVQLSAQSNRYAETSVLSKGDWYKIQVDQTGIYKLTYEQLVQMGISNPTNVSVFGYGGAQLPESFLKPYIDDLPQIPIYIEKGSDGVFGKGDYILFYAQGPVAWKYNESTLLFEHEVNTYSFYGYYFVTSDFPTQKIIQQSQELVSATTDVLTSFNDYYLYEIDKVSLLNSGRIFLGDQFNQSTLTRNYSVNIPNLIADNAQIQLSVAHVAVLDATMNVKLNNSLSETFNLPRRDNNDVVAKRVTAKYNFVPNGDKIEVNLTYGLSSSTAYLDYFTLNVRRKLQKQSNNYLTFRCIETFRKQNNFKYKLSNINSNVQIWDVTNQQNIRQIPTTIVNSDLTFVDEGVTLKEYVAVDVKKDNFLAPTIIGAVTNQDLHSLGQVDMVIISPSEFIDAAKRLAAAHYAKEGLTTHIVTPNTIYNEFSSGTPDATAYRRFMKMFYDRAKDVDDRIERNRPRDLL